MGTKVQSLLGYYSMRDLNEESSSCGWPLFYGDKALANGQYYHNHMSGAAADACSVYDKDVVKRMMLEHEAIFKSQVFELHRLYRIQRDLMDEVKMKELHRNQTSEDAKKWHIPSFPITGSSACARPSISGVEGIRSPFGSNKGVCNSPFGSNKGISKQTCLFPSTNGSSSKDVEVMESRPSKVRRKMFDLHLPADEYVDSDESEKSGDEKMSGTTIPDRNCKHGKGEDASKICGDCKTGSEEDASRSEHSLRRINGLADLNEPVQVEETNDAAYVPPLNLNPCQGEPGCSDPSAKQKSSFLGLPREDLPSNHGTDIWARNNGYLKNDGSGKVCIPPMEAGPAKSNSKSIPHVFQQEQSFLSSQTTQDALSRGQEPKSDYLTGRSKVDFWREKTVGGLDIGERNNGYSTNKQPESVLSSHGPGLFGIAAPSSGLAKSWSDPSWEMVSSSLNQKLMSAQTTPSPFLNASGALSKNSQSHRSNGIVGDGWPLNINSKPNSAFHCEASMQNGFYSGTSAGFKELPANTSSISHNYLNSNDCKKIAEPFNNGSVNYYKSSNLISDNIKSGKDINLNVLLSNGSSNDVVTQSEFGIINGERKHEKQPATLPWLSAKNTTCKNEAQNACGGRRLASGQLSFLQVTSLSNKHETGKGSSENLMNNVTSGMCSNEIEPRSTEASGSSSQKKILGVPIFDMPHIWKSSSLMSPSVSVPNPSDLKLVEYNGKNRLLDINLPCDADVLESDNQTITEIIVCEKGPSTMEVNSKNQIDLNLSMSEDEAFDTAIPTAIVNMKAVIDLEAPAVTETEEDAIPDLEKQHETPLVIETVEQPQDEFVKNAAEAIVFMSSQSCSRVDDVMSSPSERPMVNPLSWFADVVSSGVHDLQSKFDNSREKDGEDKGKSPLEELDYFESMTLQLPEMKEDEYMPGPLVPENLKVEEAGTTSLPTRARKGPARRGRQRRDFQRDILPGLSSLARHEVTEDLQTFGGLMKATGHAWHGLARRSSSRNGCGRGRRRSQVVPSPTPPVATIETCAPPKQQLNNIEVRLDDRSLTGWGKTTRRPRGQRHPAGNPPSIRLI